MIFTVHRLYYSFSLRGPSMFHTHSHIHTHTHTHTHIRTHTHKHTHSVHFIVSPSTEAVV